jgi:CheY-like chemotaxis protein
VLVVEDEPAIRVLITRILAMAGYEIVAAAGVAEALAIAGQTGDAIGLVLTDVIMPDGSGGQLAERLREQRPRLPIVFCSGFADDPRLQDGTLPNTTFVQKPFTERDLLHAVAQLGCLPGDGTSTP